MHQKINKKKIYFYFISFLFLSTISNNNFFNFTGRSFMIENISVKTDNSNLDHLLNSRLKSFYKKNIFLINKSTILSKLDDLNFIENIKVKIKYPSTLIVNANKTNFIAITYIDQKKYYVGNNKKFILAKSINYEKKLPLIFGQFRIENFLSLKKKLSDQGLEQNKIKKYYFHKNKRWDLYIEKNILLMLPNKNITEAIKLYKEFLIKNLIKSDTIVDLRINGRIILK